VAPWLTVARKPELLKGLQEAGLNSASAIQQQSLLAIFAGKSLLAKADPYSDPLNV
jgi:superfamily II DNA/RNA helicase